MPMVKPEQQNAMTETMSGLLRSAHASPEFNIRNADR
jgi:hypothetical protein